MKRILSLILTLVLLLSFTACSGNFSQMNLKDPIAIPENGIIEKSVFENIKSENAIATFTGESGDIKYEWVVFGSEIKETKDVNLSVSLEKTDKGIKIKFSESEGFGFTAQLSIYLSEKWNADSATAFDGGNAVYSVSITGSKTSILNVSIDKLVSEFEIIPDTVKKDETDNAETSDDNSLSEDTTAKPNDTTSVSEDTTTKPKDTTTVSEDTTTNSKDTSTTPDDTTSKADETTTSDKSDTTSRPVSDGKETGQDQYKTDPVPEGKPLPVEPEDQEVDKKKTYTCTFSIECSTILNNLADLDPDKRELVPSNGVILAPTTVTFYEGESVFDVLQRVCKEKGIHMESSWTPIYNSAYIEGIHNLYEFDCGELSGWMYRVNGWYPNYGCSRYQLADGEVVEWRYTCDLGNDIGGGGTW